MRRAAVLAVLLIGARAAHADDDDGPPRSQTTGEIDVQVGVARAGRTGVGAGFGGSFDKWVTDTIAIGLHADAIAGPLDRQLFVLAPQVEFITDRWFVGFDAGLALQHGAGAFDFGAAASLRAGALLGGFEVGIVATGAVVSDPSNAIDGGGAFGDFSTLSAVIGYRDR